ncbi:hypothetical protein ABZ816_21325 [Actinosynnema sp. NPDC047251]|uniref:Uncharacterized protein n=1 Tax=Saccharothrix espanaensis (strain ATCC 51144 / DSM 44229 / JCM 9112 / NBRC 15066 / NRRL 15764) TaxID=1179773 RepID=K0KC69_SACES|nr:hypothetical protein [Saccharothrix espanaensis]CCH35107.1 hypothetical protein BN6_78890 [Saccharothrix espanaensis DSM 44229]
MTGIPEAFARFRSDLDAAVTRGRRAAADAGAKTAAQRGRNRDLADRAKARDVKPEGHAPTSADLQRVATGFRAHRGLPVERLPTGAELLAPQPGKSHEQTDANANTATRRTSAGARPVAGPSGRLPAEVADDEDFSQARILY